jgi:hypothetical protein
LAQERNSGEFFWLILMPLADGAKEGGSGSLEEAEGGRGGGVSDCADSLSTAKTNNNNIT